MRTGPIGGEDAGRAGSPGCANLNDRGHRHDDTQGVSPDRRRRPRGSRVRGLRPDGRRARAGPGPAPRGGGERPARQDRGRPRALRRARGAGADEPEARRAGDGPAPAPPHGHAGVGSPSRDGRAGHRRGGAQHQSVLVQGGARSRPADHQGPEREARGGVRRASRPLRGLRHRRPAAPGSRRGAARGGRQEARAARRRHRGQRQRRGDQRSPVPPVLGQGRAARRARLHPPAGRGRRGGHAQAAQGQRLSRQRDRQPARDHHRALAPDLRGHARPLPRAQDLRGARRRLPAVVRRALRSRMPHPAGRLPRRHAWADQAEAVRVSEGDVLRHDGLLRGKASATSPPRWARGS